MGHKLGAGSPGLCHLLINKLSVPTKGAFVGPSHREVEDEKRRRVLQRVHASLERDGLNTDEFKAWRVSVLGVSA